MDEDVQSLLQTHRHRQAFERLLDLFELKLFRMAITYLTGQGRAEEVTQDIFLKLWQVLPAYDGRAAPPPGSIRSPETRASRRFALFLRDFCGRQIIVHVLDELVVGGNLVPLAAFLVQP